MIKQFIDYLVEISQESHALLLYHFSDVFEQLSQRIANNEVCCAFDHQIIMENLYLLYLYLGMC